TNLAGIALNYYVFEWHKKGPVEALGLRDLSLNSILTMFVPKPRDDKARGQRQLPNRDRRPQGGSDRGDRRPPATTERNGDGPPAGANVDRLSRQAKRRAALAPQRKASPKAPPVVRPAPPVTGRLNADDARTRRDAGTPPSQVPGREVAVDLEPL